MEKTTTNSMISIIIINKKTWKVNKKRIETLAMLYHIHVDSILCFLHYPIIYNFLNRKYYYLWTKTNVYSPNFSVFFFFVLNLGLQSLSCVIREIIWRILVNTYLQFCIQWKFAAAQSRLRVQCIYMCFALHNMPTQQAKWLKISKIC